MGVTGLFGASFDPPHNGHLALVEAACRAFGLDRVVVLVTAHPRYKDVDTPLEDRLALARAAFPGSPVEVEESTSDETVRAAEEAYGDVLFLIGADQFRDFPSWHDPEAVLEHARLGVGTRPGVSRETMQDVLRRVARPERVLFFDLPELPISSSELRSRVAAGDSIRGLVPDAVADEIEARELYRTLDG
jgi:nicotinate-nucleotide adenylyltransferase